jgi:hypothetical protein
MRQRIPDCAFQLGRDRRTLALPFFGVSVGLDIYRLSFDHSF